MQSVVIIITMTIIIIIIIITTIIIIIIIIIITIIIILIKKSVLHQYPPMDDLAKLQTGGQLIATMQYLVFSTQSDIVINQFK